MNDFDDICDRKDVRKKLDKFMNQVSVENDHDPNSIGLLLPDVNHHKLNFGDTKYCKYNSNLLMSFFYQ